METEGREEGGGVYVYGFDFGEEAISVKYLCRLLTISDDAVIVRQRETRSSAVHAS